MRLRGWIKTVDWFLLKEFGMVILFVYPLFITAAFILILFDELETMRTHHAPFLICLDYVLLRLPHEVVRFTPMVVVITTVVAIGNMIRHNEWMILHIAGYTSTRLALPLAAVLVGLIAILFIFYEYVCGPCALQAHTLMEMRIKGSSKGLAGESGIWLHGDEDRIYRARVFFPYNQEIHGLSIFEFPGRLRRETVRLDAEIAVWNPASGGWTLRNVVARTIREDGTIKREQFRTHSYFLAVPEDFARVTLDPELMSRSELARMVRDLRNAGQDPHMYLPDLRIKEAFPFAVLFLGLLAYGATVFFGVSGRTVGFGLGLITVIGYFLMLSLGESLARRGVIYPWLGAWTPNLIALSLAGYLFFRLREEV